MMTNAKEQECDELHKAILRTTCAEATCNKCFSE